MGHHLPYGITVLPFYKWTTSPVSQYSIYLSQRDGRLSWPRLHSNATAAFELAISRSQVWRPNHYTTEPLQRMPSCNRHIFCTGENVNSASISSKVLLGHHQLKPCTTCCVHRQYTPWVKKNMPPNFCLYLHQISTDFKNSFTDILYGKFVVTQLLNIPPHLYCVATLPCEI